ncbi:F-box associated ubiquitination effector family protein [Raphanus sativus]|uniref:F-box protein At1g53360 n=1 Tax=Raphanus sativus TaxID=3726 RepID=A0A6J0M6K8_RAPSA|nr:putative F-box protein At1g53360 [Raphanus sativus]KAJ4912900.1 F-box associated ubiquitination effector family protein [Raphanus sativus]
MLKQKFCRHETQSSNPIPVDLLMDVLSLVPAKTIARFRCVSKSWASIFRREDFTELFLTKSSTRPRLLFTFKVDGKLCLYSTLQPHNPDDNSSLVAAPYTSFPKQVATSTSTPVCGLFLLQERRKKKVRVVCNPATGEFLTLPKVLLREKNLLAKDTEARDKIVGMYLGYDPKRKQFKVLCMTRTSSPYEVRDNTHQVLTLGPGKRFWRPVERKFHFEENFIIWRELCINGVLYFGTGRCSYYSSEIVCFNVGSEKFSFINTNEEMRYSNTCSSLTLFNYKDRLGVHRREDTYQTRIVFWVIEDAENHKWFKHIYELSSLGKNMITGTRFVGMTSTGEFVWGSPGNHEHSLYLIFYNLEGETFTNVNVQGIQELTHQYRFIDTYVDYVENMKWLM